MSAVDTLPVLLKGLKLPAFAAHFAALAEQAEQQGWSFADYLRELCELELSQRKERRVARNLKASNLPMDKTLATLEQQRLPDRVRRRIPSLCKGGFVDRADNVLAFGLPGRGKTHLVCAVGHELIHRGYRVLFLSAMVVVQRLLAARRDLRLEEALRKLDRFDVLILDDLGYIQQDRDEMEVLFTLLSERYERKSVMLTSNLVFRDWDRIFKDPMTTAAAIDRVVHHSVILELTGPSYRNEKAAERNGSAAAAGDDNYNSPENDNYNQSTEDDSAK